MRTLLTLAAALLAFALGGCLEYHETLILRRDQKTGRWQGSAEIHLRFTKTFEPINGFIPSTVSTSDLRRLNEGLPAGVRYREAGYGQWRGTQKYIFLIVDFDDVNKLREVVPTYEGYLTREMSVPLFDDLVVTPTGEDGALYVRNALDSRKSGRPKPAGGTDAGRPVITHGPGGGGGGGAAPAPDPKEAPDAKPKPDSFIIALIKQIMKAAGDEDVTLSYEARFPDKVQASNGTHKNKEAAWQFHYPDAAGRGKIGERMTAAVGGKRLAGSDADGSPVPLFTALAEKLHEALGRGDEPTAESCFTPDAWRTQGRAFAEQARARGRRFEIESVKVHGAARGLLRVRVFEGEGEQPVETLLYEVSIVDDRYLLVGIGPAE